MEALGTRDSGIHFHFGSVKWNGTGRSNPRGFQVDIPLPLECLECYLLFQSQYNHYSGLKSSTRPLESMDPMNGTPAAIHFANLPWVLYYISPQWSQGQHLHRYLHRSIVESCHAIGDFSDVVGDNNACSVTPAPRTWIGRDQRFIRSPRLWKIGL